MVSFIEIRLSKKTELAGIEIITLEMYLGFKHLSA